MFFINCNENEKNKETHLTFHLMLYFMALLTKESAVVFPLLCFCYMVIKQYPEKLKFCLYWFVLTLVYLIIRNQITDLHYTWHYILNLKNLVINLNMVFDYFSSVFFISEIHTFTSVKILTFVKGILMIALLLFFAIRTSNRKICIFFFFWAIMFLLPNFFVERAHFQGNRMYVPMAGLIICAVMVVESIIKTRLQKYIFTTILVFFVSVSIVKTNHRIVNFQDAISFWHYEKTNNYTIWSAQQYAFALSNNGYYAEAMKEFEDLIYDRKIATKDIVLNYSLVCRLSGDIDKADRLLNDFNINSNAN
jgi:hypothetical protein